MSLVHELTSTGRNDYVIRSGESLKTLRKQYDKLSATIADGTKQLPLWLRDETNSKHQLVKKYFDFMQVVFSGGFINKAKAFSQQQTKLYQQLYEASFEKSENLYFEWLIGLGRFVLSCQLGMQFLLYLQSGSKSPAIKSAILNPSQAIFNESVFYKQLNQVSEAALTNTDELLSKLGNPKHFWAQAMAFFTAFPAYEKLARLLVGMHYLPHDKTILGKAQTLHWQGLGGSGAFIEDVLELKSLLPHCLGYHSKDSGRHNKCVSMFLEKLKIFSKRYTELLQKTVDSQTAQNVKVYDVCSGPNYSAVKKLLPSTQEMTLELTVSDVDPGALMQLSELISSENMVLKPKQVRYLDLNQLAACPPDELQRSFHIISVCLGLHQVTDQYHAINYLNAMLIDGGMLLMLDVTEDGYVQALVAPGNLADREGYLIDMKKIDLNRLAMLCAGDDSKVRLAYPLTRLACESSALAMDCPFQIYSIQAVKSLIINKKHLHVLANLWKQKRFIDCDEFLDEHYQYAIGSDFL